MFLDFRLSFSDMAKEISNFIKENVECSRKEKATRILFKLGFDFKLAGTIYILDAILYVHSYKGSYSFEKLKRDIYSYVAKINGSNIDRVKWSIARSINYMYESHTQNSYKIIENFFGIEFPKKPTPKLVISLIANSLDM